MSSELQNRGLRVLLLTPVLLVAVVGAAGCRAGSPQRAASAPCSGSAITAISAPQNNVEELGLDVTVSTESASLRESYETAALALVEQVVSGKEALKLVAFGASGVGARVVFEGSFASESDDVYNLAAENRARCWAKQAITHALATGAPRTERGTDVAGTLASLVADARSLMVRDGVAAVTLLTDGCQAPSPSGANRNLTDLCALLASGESPEQILRAHAAELSLGDARGVAVTMKGIGIGRKQSAASTVFARRLTAFWMKVCRRAHARSCQIGSAVS